MSPASCRQDTARLGAKWPQDRLTGTIRYGSGAQCFRNDSTRILRLSSSIPGATSRLYPSSFISCSPDHTRRAGAYLASRICPRPGSHFAGGFSHRIPMDPICSELGTYGLHLSESNPIFIKLRVVGASLFITRDGACRDFRNVEQTKTE